MKKIAADRIINIKGKGLSRNEKRPFLIYGQAL